MKSRFTGFTSVFKFAYIQSVKSKAFLVSMIILCGIALVLLPIITAISNAGSDDETVNKAEIIKTVYVEDNAFEGNLANAIINRLKNSGEYADKTYVLVEKEGHEEAFNKVKDSKNGDILLTIDYVEDITDMSYGFDYVVYYGENLDELDEASESFSAYLDTLHEKALGDLYIEDEAGAQLVGNDYSKEVIRLNNEGQIIEDESGITDIEYIVTYAFLMIGIFAVSLVGGKVAELIVTEKSSKVIEYIMTSIKPMALITGKVVASIAVTFTMIVGIIISFVASLFINGTLFKEKDGSMMIPDSLKSVIEGDVFKGASIVNLILIVLLIIAGFVIYGFIAGIAGATVSKIEEMAEGMKLFTFSMIVGAYVCIAYIMFASFGMGDWGTILNVIYVFPLTSMFLLPAYLLLGKATTFIAIIAVVVAIIAIVLLVIFVSGIYEYLIYYNGSPLKFKDIIKIFRNKRRA